MEYPVLDPIAIGTRIRELRMVHHFKVEDIAEFMGFESVQAVYKWQRGESLPTVDNLYALSILLETSMEYILIGKSYERDESPSLSFYRVIFTDHAPFPGNPFRNRMDMEQLPEYIKSISELKQKYQNKIEILYGLDAHSLEDLENGYKRC